MSGHYSNNLELTNNTKTDQIYTTGEVTHHSNHLVLCIVHIMMALWACVANCSQVINILRNASLRKQPKNILVVNVCVIELVIGAFLCPLYSESLMQGTWRLDVVTCIVYEVIFYAQVSISTLSVLVLVTERFLFLVTPRLGNGLERILVTVVLVALPWGIGLALVVPMFLMGATANFHEGASSCQILWTKKLQAVTVFVCFFGPAFLVLIMAAGVVMVYVVFSVIAKGRDLGSNPQRFLMRDSFRVVLLSSLTSVLLQFPFFIVLLMEIFCKSKTSLGSQPCGQSETIWAVVAGVTMLKPGLMPLTWLAYTDIRKGLGFQSWLCLRGHCWARNRPMQNGSDRYFYTLTTLNRSI